jgi:hypothetical protein
MCEKKKVRCSSDFDPATTSSHNNIKSDRCVLCRGSEIANNLQQSYISTVLGKKKLQLKTLKEDEEFS